MPKLVEHPNRILRVRMYGYEQASLGVSSSHVTRSSAVRLGSSWPGWLGTAGDRWGPLGTAGDRWGSLGTAGDAGDESFVTEFTYGKFINYCRCNHISKRSAPLGTAGDRWGWSGMVRYRA